MKLVVLVLIALMSYVLSRDNCGMSFDKTTRKKVETGCLNDQICCIKGADSVSYDSTCLYCKSKCPTDYSKSKRNNVHGDKCKRKFK